MPSLFALSPALRWAPEGSVSKRRFLFPLYEQSRQIPYVLQRSLSGYGAATFAILAYIVVEKTVYFYTKLKLEGTIWRLPPGCKHVNDLEQWHKKHAAFIPPTESQMPHEKHRHLVE